MPVDEKNNALDEIHNLKGYVDALLTLACTNDDQVPLSATNLYHLLKPIEEKITHIVKCLSGGLQ